MTELQMGLIGLGAFAVIGVLAYNKWQEVRQRKQAEQALQGSHPDVLLNGVNGQRSVKGEAVAKNKNQDEAPAFPEKPRDAMPAGERIEPVLILDTEPEGEFPEERESAAEPGFSASDGENREPVLSPSASVRDMAFDPEAADVEFPDYSPLLSPQIDFIAAIAMVDPVAASDIRVAQSDALSQAKKPVRWIGYNEHAAKWEVISDRSSGEFRHIRAGLQLADRQGPASDNDLAVFSTAMQDLADQFSGIADLPSRQSAFETAGKLDEFCAGVDIQIGINVISRGQAFPGTKLRTLAEVAGMALDADKRFVRRDEDGNILFVLLNQDTAGFTPETVRTLSTHGVTFLLDVPGVANGVRVFNQMVDLARHFAEVLQGELVDDNQRPLTEGSMEPIRQQIAHYQAVLAERHLPAGSALTRRLFS